MDNVCCGDLREELWRGRAGSRDAAFLFRLCSVRLVLSGQRPGDVGEWLDLSERTVRRWVALYQEGGTQAVRRGVRAGRPGHLGEGDLAAVLAALRDPPGELGLPYREWHGAMLQQWVRERFGVELGIRQCQRLLRLARHAESGSLAGLALGPG